MNQLSRLRTAERSTSPVSRSADHRWSCRRDGPARAPEPSPDPSRHCVRETVRRRRAWRWPGVGRRRGGRRRRRRRRARSARSRRPRLGPAPGRAWGVVVAAGPGSVADRPTADDGIPARPTRPPRPLWTGEGTAVSHPGSESRGWCASRAVRPDVPHGQQLGRIHLLWLVGVATAILLGIGLPRQATPLTRVAGVRAPMAAIAVRSSPGVSPDPQRSGSAGRSKTGS